MVISIDYPEDYEKLLLKNHKTHSVEERRKILEGIRVHHLFQPDIVLIHGSQLLSHHSGKLGDEIWAIYEQVCMAALHLGMMAWSAFCVEKLIAKFPNSKRVKRIYALYREAVGEWPEAVKIYREILQDAPENTFSRKRLIAMRRSQGRNIEAIEAANKYLEIFGTDKDMWHELADLYLEEAQLQKAMFCFEDMILQDCRNTYSILSYAELAYSVGNDFELARKYFCLACEIDEKNVRALWGLFLTNCQLAKRDQGNDKMTQLQSMTIQKLKKLYAIDLKHEPSSKIMLEVLEEESAAVEALLLRDEAKKK